jgi:hypothetical protein
LTVTVPAAVGEDHPAKGTSRPVSDIRSQSLSFLGAGNRIRDATTTLSSVRVYLTAYGAYKYWFPEFGIEGLQASAAKCNWLHTG